MVKVSSNAKLGALKLWHKTLISFSDLPFYPKNENIFTTFHLKIKVRRQVLKYFQKFFKSWLLWFYTFYTAFSDSYIVKEMVNNPVQQVQISYEKWTCNGP